MTSILARNKNLKPKEPKKTRADYAEDALYREVWEEVNNDKTMAFIKKYSNVLIGGALVLLILVTGAQIGLRTYRANKMAMATNYEVALEKVDANALASIGENGRGANADLAMFQSYLIDHDISKMEKLAEIGKTPEFRDLARLHVISVRGDEMGGDDVEKYLSPIANKKSPFYYTAMLTIAQKYVASGDKEKANVWLDKILSDSECPQEITMNAEMLK
ncbi:MAG: hypothetical protein ACLRFI_02100 [Alphaproteobacteria bacterium]